MAHPPPPEHNASFSPAPEILSPDPTGMSVPNEPPRPLKRSWAYAPATYILVGINCVVFLFMVLRGVSLMSPTGDQLLHWGATYPAAILYDAQWWRIVTAMFVHVGVIHLATNMWCLWNLGLLGEPLLGPLGLTAAYVLSGAAGNLLSVGVSMYYRHDNIVGAGASGAVFGIAGVLIILLKSPRLAARVPAVELKALRRNVIYFALVNFVIGFGSSFGSNFMHLGVNIDNMAHLGGLIGGLIFALPLVPRPGSPRREFLFRRRLAVGLLTCILVFFGVYLSAVFPVPPLPMQQ